MQNNHPRDKKKLINIKALYEAYMVFIGVFGQLVFYAQGYKIFTTKSAYDVSLIGFTVGLISVTSWLIYGIMIKNLPLITANAVACIGALAVVVGILLYS